MTDQVTKVSTIVVNWNGASLLKDCLGSLLRQTCVGTEGVFVDNGSTDFSVRYVKEQFPSVKVVELSENRGFAGGNVAGRNRRWGGCPAKGRGEIVDPEAYTEEIFDRRQPNFQKAGDRDPK